MKRSSVSESKEIKRLVLITLIVVGVVGLVYVFTRAFITKDLKSSEKSESSITVDYDMATVGMILNRPYNEYYVYLYHDASDSVRGIVSDYAGKDDSLKVYYVDLSESVNEPFYSTESSPQAKEMSEFKFGDNTLLKISDKKIVKYLESESEIEKELIK